MPVSSKFELYTNKWPFSLSALFPLYIFSPDACLHSCVSSFRQGNRPAFNPVALLNGRVYHLPSTFALNGTLNPTGCTSRRFDLQPFQSDRIGLPTISLHIHILVPYAPYTLMQQPTRLISNQIFQVSVNLRYSGRLYDYQPNPSHFL